MTAQRIEVLDDATAAAFGAYLDMRDQRDTARATAVELHAEVMWLEDRITAVAALVKSMHLPCRCIYVTTDPDTGPVRQDCEACLLNGMLGLA